MAWQDMLVYLDESRQAPDCLNVAVDLCERYQARLTGLTIAPLGYVPAYFTRDMSAQQEKAVRERNERVKQVFEKGTGRSELSTEWRAVVAGDTGAGVVDTLALHSRYADLAVVGQPDPDTRDDTTPLDLPGQLAIAAGRPVLAVPYAWKPHPVGKRVIVAWNGSREATRAVHDALPLLRQANNVEILAMTPPDSKEGHGDQPGADIARHLARHGINCTANHKVVEDIKVPDALLNEVVDYGADLMVMGAYGKSRLREIVMGGASRGVLTSMTVPVLLAH